MKYRTHSAVWLLLCVISPTGLWAQDGLDEILTQMEKRGDDLQSMRARIQQKKWTDIIEEFDEGEEGTFLFLRHQGEVYLRKDIEQPQISHFVISKGVVLFYQPAIKQAQKYQLGTNKDKAEFLLLGFGTSRSALEEAYEIRLLGSPEVGGRLTYQIELKPRSDQASAFFSRIVLWVDPEIWVPVQQILVEPTDDYLLVNFEDIELNPKLKPSEFQLRIPAGVKVLG